MVVSVTTSDYVTMCTHRSPMYHFLATADLYSAPVLLHLIEHLHFLSTSHSLLFHSMKGSLGKKNAYKELQEKTNGTF